MTELGHHPCQKMVSCWIADIIQLDRRARSLRRSHETWNSIWPISCSAVPDGVKPDAARAERQCGDSSEPNGLKVEALRQAGTLFWIAITSCAHKRLLLDSTEFVIDAPVRDRPE